MQEFITMQKGDTLRIKALPNRFTMLHPRGHNHYDTLRKKLYWNCMPTEHAALPATK
jgi:NAD+ kinase